MIVNTPQGLVEFPESMSQEDVLAVLRQKFPPEKPFSFSSLLPTAARVAGGLGALLGPVGGGAGAGLGEAGAEAIEKLRGTREQFSPAEVISQALLGAIPGAKVGAGLKGLIRPVAGEAARGAAIAASPSVFEKGEMPGVAQVALGAVLGGGGGAVGGKIAQRRAAADYLRVVARALKDARLEEMAEGVERGLMGIPGHEAALSGTDVTGEALARLPAGEVLPPVRELLITPTPKAQSRTSSILEAAQRTMSPQILEPTSTSQLLAAAQRTLSPGAPGARGEFVGVEAGRPPGELQAAKKPPQARKVQAPKLPAETPPGPEQVVENLVEMAREAKRPKAQLARDFEEAYRTFPQLETERLSLGTQRVIEEAAIEKLTDSALGAQIKSRFTGERRAYLELADLIREGKLDAGNFMAMKARSGMTDEDVAKEWMEVIHEYGAGLRQFQEVTKLLSDVAPGVAKAMAKAKGIPPVSESIWYKAYRVPVNIWRGLLVTQVKTQMRNALSQGVRFGPGALDEALTEVFSGRPLGAVRRSTETLTSFFHQLPGAKGAKEVYGILDKFPAQYGRLMGSPMLDVYLGDFGKILSFLGNLQETFWRRAAFEAKLRGELRGRGMGWVEALSQPERIPREAIDRSVDEALLWTFAYSPARNTLSRSFIDLVQKTPGLQVLEPFPRFHTNALSFLVEHSPLGLFMQSRPLTGRVAPIRERLARSTTGLVMLSAAMALRYSPLAGDNWRFVKAGKRLLDFAAYNPLSSWLFFADLVRNANSKLHGRDPEAEIGPRDWIEAVGQSKWVPGSVWDFLGVERTWSLDQIKKIATDAAGSFVGGFTVPLRQVKDLFASLGTEEEQRVESIMRGARGSESFFAPVLVNIPGLSRHLPPEASPLRAGPITFTHPGISQMTGVNIREPTAVETEVGRLGRFGLDYRAIYPHPTSHPEVDRQQRKLEGEEVERKLGRVISSPSYQSLNDKRKAVLLGDLISGIKRGVRERVLRQYPEVGREERLKRLPVRRRALLLEGAPPIP